MQETPSVRVRRADGFLTNQALRGEIQQTLEALAFGPPSLRAQTVSAFEAAFAQAAGQRFARAVHSGTVALLMALKACGVEPGSEVITVANSDISNTAAISLCGAIPVLCDVRESDHTLDASCLEPLITSRTAAIMAIDMHGHPADVRQIREIADRRGLKVIEDAALSLGARDYGKPVGAFADATTYSFGGSKILGSLGNGGAVATNDAEVWRRLQLVSSYGQDLERREGVRGYQRAVAEGYNVPIDPFQAGVLRIKLPYLEEWTARRRAVARAYEDGLRGLPLQLPTFRPESQPTFRSYTIRVADQERVYRALLAEGIEASLFYAPPIHHQPAYSKGLPGSDRLPVTEKLGAEIVSLPVTSEIDDAQTSFVVETLRRIL